MEKTMCSSALAPLSCPLHVCFPPRRARKGGRGSCAAGEAGSRARLEVYLLPEAGDGVAAGVGGHQKTSRAFPFREGRLGTAGGAFIIFYYLVERRGGCDNNGGGGTLCLERQVVKDSTFIVLPSRASRPSPKASAAASSEAASGEMVSFGGRRGKKRKKVRRR